MIFTPTPIPGAFVVDPERFADERGFFARSFCQREFGAQGLTTEWAQTNISFNRERHTLRGMHWQAEPHHEAKLVRATAGAVFDVILDLRPDSPAYKRHFSVELSAENRRMLYVPPLCAHGFLTLAPATELLYYISKFFEPAAGRGVRFDDPAFAIPWPAAPAVINERDRTYPDFAG